MTTEAAAEYLNLSTRTVFRLIKRGSIEAEKFGPVWMIPRKSLDEYRAIIEGKSKHDPTRSQVKGSGED